MLKLQPRIFLIIYCKYEEGEESCQWIYWKHLTFWRWCHYCCNEDWLIHFRGGGFVWFFFFLRKCQFYSNLSAGMCPISGRNCPISGRHSLGSELQFKPFCCLVQKKTNIQFLLNRARAWLGLLHLVGMHQTTGHWEKRDYKNTHSNSPY